MKRALGLAAASLVVLAAAAPKANALGARLPFDEIVQKGSTIVVATVVSSSTRWGEGKKMIWTDYALSVEEVWKGAPARSLTVSFAGGTVDGRSIAVSHVPALEPGETYVLSLHAPGRLFTSPVVGAEQGLFREVTDAASGERVLLDAEGFAVALGKDGFLARLAGSEPAGAPGSVTLRRPAPPLGSPSHGIGEPVYRDGLGRPLPAPAEAPALAVRASQVAPPAGTPLTRRTLRDAVRRTLEGR